jgi:hypothetical protein
MRTVKALVLSLGLVLVVDNVVTARQSVDDTRKLAEFYGPNWESAMARLDNFAVELQANPNAVGVLIVYGGQLGRRGEARAWSACIRSYLVDRRGIAANRIVMVNGGYRKTLTVEMWETTDRNHMPNPQPHIKPRDVRFKKGKARGLCEI